MISRALLALFRQMWQKYFRLVPMSAETDPSTGMINFVRGNANFFIHTFRQKPLEHKDKKRDIVCMAERRQVPRISNQYIVKFNKQGTLEPRFWAAAGV